MSNMRLQQQSREAEDVGQVILAFEATKESIDDRFPTLSQENIGNSPSSSTGNPSISAVAVGVLLSLAATVGVSIVEKRDAILKNIPAGFVLYATDVSENARDHVLTFPSNTKSTTALIWDYAAEDGDELQVEANGVPITPRLVIKNTPISVTVPVGSVINVTGIKDGGGGGITYAIRFPDLSTSITNGVSPGANNAYTLQTAPKK
jgi:hypothetical protein